MTIDAIIFDLNGTLLDMSALDARFDRVFHAPLARERWFGELRTLWMTTIATGEYQPFDKLAAAALRMLAAIEQVTISADNERQILEAMMMLPAFPEVPLALPALKARGYRLAALTNGSLKSARSQLAFANLRDIFEEIFSVESVKCFKPGKAPYAMVAEKMDLAPNRQLMVAAHGWDIAGARQAGMRTAFISRPRQALNPDDSKPDYLAPDVLALHQLLAS